MITVKWREMISLLILCFWVIGSHSHIQAQVPTQEEEITQWIARLSEGELGDNNAATEALIKIGQLAIPYLLDVFESDPPDTQDRTLSDVHWTRLRAAYCLSMMNYPDVVTLLSQIDNPDVQLRVALVFPLKYRDKILPILQKSLDHPDAQTRLKIAEKLADLGQPDGFEILLDGEATVSQIVTGNYELNLMLTGDMPSQEASVFFTGNKGSLHQAYLAISDQVVKLVRKTGNNAVVWKRHKGAGTFPWKIRILKKGNFFRYWVNDTTGWIRGPLGEWENVYEPVQNMVNIKISEGITIQLFTITTLPWLQQVTSPVIACGPKESFYEKQIIPGAIIEYNGKYYMYCMAGMEGNEEGSSRRTIAVATSDNLKNWEVHPKPLMTYENLPYDNLYVSGAVVTPEKQVAIMFSAQQFPEWKGFMLATASHPMGPFTLHRDNPVYKHFSHAHEFDLLRVDHAEYRYVLFYAGFTPNPQSGPPGDRGYLLYSNDLINWRSDQRNPVFGPETADNWDAIHVRPRSLNKIGDTWYLWYEGANQWVPPIKTADGRSHHGWWDTVGLARSVNLIDWEYYPRNPALPGLGIGIDQFDSRWVGWPRMFVKDGMGYIFYTGDAQVGLRSIRIEQLTDWQSEGGKVLDMLNQTRTTNE